MSEHASFSTATEEEENHFELCSSEFSDVVKTKAFVDKTLLIETILTGEKMIQINAPRGFGKSTNMDMLKKFLEIQVDESGAVINREESSNYEIFKGHNLLIYQNRYFFNRYFATYPVIYLDFKTVSGNTVDEILDKLIHVLRETFKLYSFLLQSDNLYIWDKKIFSRYCEGNFETNLNQRNNITGAVVILSECLFKHFNKKKVFVLIDESDEPINNIMVAKVHLETTNQIICAIFASISEPNEYVERVLLTGTSSFAYEDYFMYNPPIERYKFLDDHQYVKFYGLTQPEVDALLRKFNVDEETKLRVHAYYNGYCTVTNDKVFSTASVIQYLQNGKLKSYRQQCDMITRFKNALNFRVNRYAIEALCLRNSLHIRIIREKPIIYITLLQRILVQEGLGTNLLIKPDIYLSFLLEQGYLTYENVIDARSRHYIVKIPNSEIFYELQEKLKEYYGPSVNSCLDACANIFKEICSSSEDEIFQDFISMFILLLTKLHIKIIERSQVTCHYLLFNILCKVKYSIGAELHVTEEKPYLMLYKDCVGIIIKLKYARSADAALKNVIAKYVNVFNVESCFKNVTEKIYIGMNVNENDTANMKVLVNCLDLTEAKIF